MAKSGRITWGTLPIMHKLLFIAIFLFGAMIPVVMFSQTVGLSTRADFSYAQCPGPNGVVARYESLSVQSFAIGSRLATAQNAFDDCKKAGGNCSRQQANVNSLQAQADSIERQKLALLPLYQQCTSPPPTVTPLWGGGPPYTVTPIRLLPTVTPIRPSPTPAGYCNRDSDCRSTSFCELSPGTRGYHFCVQKCETKGGYCASTCGSGTQPLSDGYSRCENNPQLDCCVPSRSSTSGSGSGATNPCLDPANIDASGHCTYYDNGGGGGGGNGRIFHN